MLMLGDRFLLQHDGGPMYQVNISIRSGSSGSMRTPIHAELKEENSNQTE